MSAITTMGITTIMIMPTAIAMVSHSLATLTPMLSRPRAPRP